jgi:hypothetical protein
MLGGVARQLLTIGTLVAVAVAGTCSAFGCGDELPVTESDGGPSEASPSNDGPVSTLDGALDDGGGADGAGSDALASSCDVSQPQNVYYQATFDTNCEGYAAENGDVQHVDDPRRCGAGACRVCVTGNAQPVLYRYINHAEIEAGTYELRYNVQNDTFDASLSATLYVYAEAGVGLLGNNSNTTPFVPGQWAQGQVVANAPGTSTQTLVRITAPTAIAGCFFIDELQIGRY